MIGDCVICAGLDRRGIRMFVNSVGTPLTKPRRRILDGGHFSLWKASTTPHHALKFVCHKCIGRMERQRA
jgi:hypothetical protein